MSLIVALGWFALNPQPAPASANSAAPSAASGPTSGTEVPFFATPPMGWANWNSLQCNYNDAKIRQEVDMLVSSGLAAAGYKLIRIQECIFTSRDGSGNLVPNPAKFPLGLQSLVDYIHSKGMLAGVYTDAGTFTCAGAFPGSYNHEQQDADSFASWGFDWVEVDWCNIPFEDFPGQTHQQVAQTLVTRMHDAIANSGRGMALHTFAGWDPTTNPWQWGPAVPLAAWRTGGDLWQGGTTSWANVLTNFDKNALHPEATGVGHYNDPDMLAVALGSLSDLEGQSHFSLWAMSAAPLSIGTDLTNPAQFTAATKATYLNTDVIAVDQDPLAIQGTLVSDQLGKQVWKKPLADGSVAVLLLNRGAAPATISTTAAAAGLPAAGQYTMKDLWTKVTTQTAESISALVPSHGVSMFRVSPITTLVDDRVVGPGENQFNYAGSGWDWCGGNCGNANPAPFEGTVSWNNITGRSVSISFTGTKIDLYGQTQYNGGIGAVSVDGSPPVNVDFYSDPDVGKKLIYTSPALPLGPHTLTLTVTGTKNVASVGTFVLPDAVGITSWTLVDDRVVGPGLNQFNYAGSGWGWCGGNCEGANPAPFEDTVSWNNITGRSVSISFNGTKIQLYGQVQDNGGIGAVSVDGSPPVNVDFYSSNSIGKKLIYTSPALPPGPHTLTLTVTGTKNVASSGFFVVPDAVGITP